MQFSLSFGKLKDPGGLFISIPIVVYAFFTFVILIYPLLFAIHSMRPMPYALCPMLSAFSPSTSPGPMARPQAELKTCRSIARMATVPNV